MAEVIPSILVKTAAEFKEKLDRITGHFSVFHLDIADGIFVPNTTIDGVKELASLETDLVASVHLMVSKPENHIAHWLDSPVERIIFHLEATEKAIETIAAIHEGERLAGLAINPQTPIERLADYIETINCVHFMTVEPGFYGGKFIESVVEKIKEFHYFYPDKLISVDGGINPETAPKLVAAGAGELVVGSYLYSSDIGEATEEIKTAINV